MEEPIMTSFEKAEIRRLPKKYRPMGAWGYFWHSVLYAIPVIGWICLIWGACSDKRIVRRSFARTYFVALLIALIIVGVVALLFALNVITPDMVTDIKDKIVPPSAI